MKYFIKNGVVLALVLMASIVNSYAQKRKQTKNITFEKTVLTSRFISEGASIGDINKDGKMDVLSGAYWFEAPNWTPHEIAKPDTFVVKGSYSNAFLNFAMDVNQDGWVDLIRVDWPGKAAVWHENPKNKSGHWPAHVIYESVGNESPLLVDVDGDGRLDLICNDPTLKQVIWVKSPTKKGDTKWEKFIISTDPDIATHVYTHGLGYGDINGDGRKDVIVKNGWWEGPVGGAGKQAKDQPWKFHPSDISKDCAQMYVMDLNGDGLNDVISSSAHEYGVWWHEQGKDSNGKMTWTHHEIDMSNSQTHGLELFDMNGDGHLDLITGKRYFAHSGGDPGAFEPAMTYWYEYKPGKKPTWTRHVVDNDAGAGLHVTIGDLNKDKLPDIITANKKGVFIFKQKK